MTSTYDPRMLPLAAFARSGEQLSGSAPLADLPRLYAQSVDAVRDAVGLAFERDFRFVANEALAAAEDEESEEDVLVFARQFDLLDLVEDELLMAMPLVPMHETCPVTPRFSVADADFDAAASQSAKPFAVLADWKRTPAAD